MDSDADSSSSDAEFVDAVDEVFLPQLSTPPSTTPSTPLQSSTVEQFGTECDPPHQPQIVCTTEVPSEPSSSQSLLQPTDLPKPPPRRKKKPTSSLSSHPDADADRASLSYENASLFSFTDGMEVTQGDLSLDFFPLSKAVRDDSSTDEQNISSEEFKEESPDVTLKEDKQDTTFTAMQDDLTLSNSQHREAFDEAMLEKMTLLNKDAGQEVPLDEMGNLLERNVDQKNSASDYQSDDEETSSQSNEGTASQKGGEASSTLKANAFRNGVKKLKHNFIKGVRHVRHRDKPAESPSLDLQYSENYPSFKLKVNHKRPVADFEGVKMLQELNDCRGKIWCMKWSLCGQLLAVGGQDKLLRIYCSYKAWNHFTNLRRKSFEQQISPSKERSSSIKSSRSNSITSDQQLPNFSTSSPSNLSDTSDSLLHGPSCDGEGPLLLFSVYKGHKADVVDISWSKSDFLISASLDKTVRLWHIARIECLATYGHKDVVTTVNFHPKNDRYFLSGSWNGALHLWDILGRQKKWSQSVDRVITASSFADDGKFSVIGTFDGKVIFFLTEGLKYFTQINVGGTKNVGNNKVTGIENVQEKKILVTTNDSRVRLFDRRDLSFVCKYKGCVNNSSQIRASVSPDNKYIVCGSEDSSFYLWRLREEVATGQRRDRNEHWERIRLIPTPVTTTPLMAQQSNKQRIFVTSTSFSPNPSHLDRDANYVIAIGDSSGNIKLFAR